MGCGKTTLGRKLAKHLGYAFIDLDEVLEQTAGMTIAEYFAKHGEDQFRLLESRVLKETVYPTEAIVSTGGGLPCFFDHIDWMNAHGKTLYISMPPKALAERLENGNQDRPLLREKRGEALVAFIEEKLAQREPFYKQATHTLSGLSINPAQVAEVLKG